MLGEFRIKNYALIEGLELSFPPGLTVLTGETGAGKSIVLEALALLLGRRAEISMLRDRKQKAVVEGVFTLEKEGLLVQSLREIGVEAGKELLLQREFSPAARSRVLVEGRLSTVERLSEIGDLLVDFHGQHKHQSLLRQACQLDLLDAFGGTLKQRASFRELWRERSAIRKRLMAFGGDPRELERRLDIIRYQCKEIEQAKLAKGELAELEREFAMLENVDRLRLLIGEAVHLLNADEAEAGDAASSLARVTGLLQQAGELETSLDQNAASAEQLSAGVNELAAELAGYLERLEFNQERHGQLRERLDLINGLLKKYGPDESSVLKYLERMQEELEDLEGREGKTEGMKKDLAALEKQLAKAAEELSRKRKESTKRLKDVVERELAGLGMESATFAATLWRKEGADLQVGGEGYAAAETGLEHVDFMLSANPGEEIKPLRTIISGGELSRIMLGLKVVLGELSDVPAMVFDEVDTGIGGETAWAVGERLARLAETHQVFAVTHLPQIASFAGNHLVVSKEKRGGRSLVSVKAVRKGEREKEIARMLGDGKAAGASLEHAREILARASATRTTGKKEEVKGKKQKVQ